MKRTTDKSAGRGPLWWALCGVLGLCCAGCLPAQAQEAAQEAAKEADRADAPDSLASLVSWPPSHAYVDIHTNFPEALVFADSLFVGGASRMPLAVPAGSRSIRLTAPRPDAWSIAPITRPLEVAAGDTAHVVVHFPYHYRIESEPFGADVFVERRGEPLFVGATPLLHRSEAPLEGSILLQRRGYLPASVQPGNAVWNRHVAHLEPMNARDPAAVRYSNPPRTHRAWIDYAVLGAALAAGAAAVHYKFKADSLADEYERTRNATLTSRIETHDVRAAAAFGVMQGGLGIFAIRLALR